MSADRTDRTDRLRTGLVVLGALLTGYGAVLLLGTGFGNVRGAAVWLAGGVIVHDGLVAPLSILVVAIALRVLPGRVRGWAAAAAVVVATTTVVAVPVLGRPGARPDNPTLLPRDYVAGWLVVVAVVVAVVVVLAGLEAMLGHLGHLRHRRAAARPGADEEEHA